MQTFMDHPVEQPAMRAPADPRVTVESISPNTAARYLACNTANRPLKKAWVATLAAAMQRGDWRLNGETIKFSSDGRLLDGQNRLHAIIRAGVPQTMMVARGIDADVFDTLDQGVKRSAADILSIGGEKNAAALAATARMILSIENADFNQAYTTQQIEAAVESHPTVREWISRFIGSKAKLLAPSAVPAVLTLGAERHGDAVAGHFLHLLATGAQMEAKHPVLTLRDRLIEARSSRIKQLRQVAIAAYVVKAWNAYIEGRSVSLYRFHPLREDFPIIK